MRLAGPLPSCKVYTSPDLAEAMVQALGDAPNALWLEPSHGEGVFVNAISQIKVEKARIVALDLDPTVVACDHLAKTLRGVDFLRWANTTDQRFDRIIGNPPFVPISRLPPSLQKSAAATMDLKGQPIGKGANVWYAFVLASLRLLRKGGSLAFVLPSAAEFADYSAELRRSVAKSFGILDLYNCTRPLFDDVQEGTLVAVARCHGSGPGEIVRRRFLTRTALIAGLSQSGPRNGHKCPGGRIEPGLGVVTLGSVAKIAIGGVTGHVDFFLMNEDRRKSLELPLGALTPVVSKARHLRSASLSPDEWQKLKKAGERTWLFDPPDALLTHPKVRKYLELDTAKGGCNRGAHKVSNRDPWFRTPMPRVPDAFLSGMSQLGPWLCINETTKVNATNTLYIVSFSSRNRGDWYKFALALLSSAVQRQIRRIGRRYPDGLIKHEPGSLAAIRLPSLEPGADHKGLYFKAVAALLEGRAGIAKKIADAIVCSS